jgi:hypothetical protein
MEAEIREIRLVPTRSAQYLNQKEFHSGVVEAINQLLEELAKPRKIPVLSHNT